jgi:hypothetical protein
LFGSVIELTERDVCARDEISVGCFALIFRDERNRPEILALRASGLKLKH